MFPSHDHGRRIKEGKDGKDGSDGRDGKDGKDADETKILNELTKKIPKLDETKFQRKIEELEKELEEVKKKARGGGTSAIGIANAAKYFVKTEAPTGDIDGANTAYTVSKPIFAVLAFSLNGEFIARLPNYTISNKTVTFTTALPAAYSGKDFEITYI